MASGEPVKKFYIVVNVAIRDWGDKYDWVTEDGDESDYLLDTIEAAEEDARNHLG